MVSSCFVLCAPPNRRPQGGGEWDHGASRGIPACNKACRSTGALRIPQPFSHSHRLRLTLVWWQSVSCGGGRAQGILGACSCVFIALGGEADRPDLVAFVASGLFDLCIEGVAAFEARGTEGLDDTHHGVVYQCLHGLSHVLKLPRCQAKIRGVAASLAFCMGNNLDYMSDVGSTSGGVATRICEMLFSPRHTCVPWTLKLVPAPPTDRAGCGVFGRDEGGSEFTFTQQQIDTLVTHWRQLMEGKGLGGAILPDASRMASVLELCVSGAFALPTPRAILHDLTR
eukprot:SAG31_NODE_454_length_15434_cov_39.578285_7_plen_284_part_00